LDGVFVSSSLLDPALGRIRQHQLFEGLQHVWLVVDGQNPFTIQNRLGHVFSSFLLFLWVPASGGHPQKKKSTSLKGLENLPLLTASVIGATQFDHVAYVDFKHLEAGQHPLGISGHRRKIFAQPLELLDGFAGGLDVQVQVVHIDRGLHAFLPEIYSVFLLRKSLNRLALTS
jgi:hypothetical protein